MQQEHRECIGFPYLYGKYLAADIVARDGKLAYLLSLSVKGE